MVVMQPFNHAILYNVSKRRGPPGFLQNALCGVYSDREGGQDINSPRDNGTKLGLCTTKDRA